LTDEDWRTVLRAAHAALRPGGRLVFEVRDPTRQAWRSWTRDRTHRVLEIPGAGTLEAWTDLAEVALPLVSFRQSFVFEADGATLESHSTLRFRDRADIVGCLRQEGFAVEEVRGAADRPGLELVFVTTRSR
jgi:hypothetical protein